MGGCVRFRQQVISRLPSTLSLLVHFSSTQGCPRYSCGLKRTDTTHLQTLSVNRLGLMWNQPFLGSSSKIRDPHEVQPRSLSSTSMLVRMLHKNPGTSSNDSCRPTFRQDGHRRLNVFSRLHTTTYDPSIRMLVRMLCLQPGCLTRILVLYQDVNSVSILRTGLIRSRSSIAPPIRTTGTVQGYVLPIGNK